LVVRLFRLVDRYAVNILFCDQWKFDDATLFQNHSWLEIFRWQHGPHRQGLGGILSKLFEPWIDWNSRYEAFAMVAVIACACLAALWLKQRLFGEIDYSDVVIPLLFFTPVQYETLLGATNPSHGPLPLLLVVLYCLAWTIANSYRKYVTVLLLNILLIYTGFGLFMGFVTPLLLGLDFYLHRNRLAMISLVIAVLSMSSFFLGYRYDPAVPMSSPQLGGSPLHYYALFVGFMFSTFINIPPVQALVIPAILVGSGLALLTSLTAGNMLLKLRVGKVDWMKSLVIVALLGYSLIFCFATAYGRTGMGLGAPKSRYMTYLVLAFFGLYLAALSAKVKIERRAFLCLVLLLALLSSTRIEAPVQRSASARSEQLRTWKECYLSGGSIEQCDSRSGSFIYWTPEPPDLQWKLDYLRRFHLNLYSSR